MKRREREGGCEGKEEREREKEGGRKSRRRAERKNHHWTIIAFMGVRVASRDIR